MLFKTPPLQITDAIADTRHTGGLRVGAPQMIVLHHTGKWPALEWLTVDGGSNVSAHRYIEPNKPIFKLVDDARIANTQGYADVGPWSDVDGLNFNTVCLSIEGCYNPLTDRAWSQDVVLKMAMQTCEWWGIYGLLPILYHKQVDRRKDDPANFPRPLFDMYLMLFASKAMRGELKTWDLA